MQRHRSRLKDAMMLNANLVLPFDTLEEAEASGIFKSWWIWSVANAAKQDRDRIAARCTNPQNQATDVQYIF